MKRCEEVVQNFTKDPKFKAFFEAVGELDINCVVCDGKIGPEGNAKAMLLDEPLTIEICSNRHISDEQIAESLVHEFTHAYDYKLKRYDFSSCEGLASSEVRAARNAECNKYFVFDFLKSICIQGRAAESTKVYFASPKCLVCYFILIFFIN